MTDKTYTPNPIDLSSIQIPEELFYVIDPIAEHLHDEWALEKMRQGWKLGELDGDAKTHPDLIPYRDLPEKTKKYDIKMAVNSLKLCMHFGILEVSDAT